MRLVWVIAALLVTQTARADDYHTVIDQVWLEPSPLGGQRLRVDVSIVELQGKPVELPDAKSIKASIGGSKTDAPVAVGAFGQTGSDMAIAFVVQTSVDYTEVLPAIADAIDQNILATASDRTQIALLTYGESANGGKFTSAKSARGKITGLSSDGSVGEPLLLDTVERALVSLRKVKTKPEGRQVRKMIVVIGDGRDIAGDKDRVVKLGQRALREDVRIHTFAYSPKDQRRPLLLLGELSKQSIGTFRWVRGAKTDSWTPALQQLASEINKEIVLTFFLAPDDDASRKTVKIQTTGRYEIQTKDHKIPEAGCAGQPCEAGQYCAESRCIAPLAAHKRSVLRWVLTILGILVGIVLMLGVVGFILTKRQEAGKAPKPPRPATVPPPQPQAAQVPSTAPPSMAPPEPAPAAPATAARFYVMSGPLAGTEIPLRHGFMIGKQPGCDLVIDDGYTSSHHAQIAMDHLGNTRIYDRQSTNGTFVNGVRVNSDWPLEHGNTVRIGSTELRFLAQ